MASDKFHKSENTFKLYKLEFCESIIYILTLELQQLVDYLKERKLATNYFDN